MARIMALDYGEKRCGIATTDPQQLIAAPLITVPTEELLGFLLDYFQNEEVECLVIGLPLQRDGEHTPLENRIRKLVRSLERHAPDVKIARQEEAYTSVRAAAVLRQSGAKRKKRQEKGLLDKISASLILNDYLGF